MLDTNIAIYVIKRRPIDLLTIFNQQSGYLCVSSITLAELMHGVEKSNQIEKNLKNVEDFISRLEVLQYDNNAACHYGNIRAELEKKGTTIGVNDLHIAGHCRSLGLIIVTNNVREFERVPGLRMENWVN